MTVRCSKSAFIPFWTCGRKLASRVDRPGCLLSLSGIAKTCIRNWCSRPHIPAFAALSQKTSSRFDAASWLLSPSGLAEENLRHELIDQAAFYSFPVLQKPASGIDVVGRTFLLLRHYRKKLHHGAMQQVGFLSPSGLAEENLRYELIDQAAFYPFPVLQKPASGIDVVGRTFLLLRHYRKNAFHDLI